MLPVIAVMLCLWAPYVYPSMDLSSSYVFYSFSFQPFFPSLTPFPTLSQFPWRSNRLWGLAWRPLAYMQCFWGKVYLSVGLVAPKVLSHSGAVDQCVGIWGWVFPHGELCSIPQLFWLKASIAPQFVTDTLSYISTWPPPNRVLSSLDMGTVCGFSVNQVGG